MAIGQRRDRRCRPYCLTFSPDIIMSILQINDLSYVHADRTPLFEGVSFAVENRQKIALIGPNGSGKSTLLRLIAGLEKPVSGGIAVGGRCYYVPQHFGQYNGTTIAGALGIDRKIDALHAILSGDLSEANDAVLGDDWSIEERAAAALDAWGLSGFGLDQPLETLSGGEKTRVFLSGIAIREPALILMDEPSNHLDRSARERLYALIRDFPGAMLVVSHDRTLLDLLDTTLELGPKGVTPYGGNYEFYKEQRENKLRALQERIDEREKSLRTAQRAAREAAERKEKQDVRGRGKMKKERAPRILLKTIADGAAASAKRLNAAHAEKIESITQEISHLREQNPVRQALKIKFDDSTLHTGKMLVTADRVNFSYGEKPLWPRPLSLVVRSGERIAIEGENGSGKTTLLKLILGALEPTEGTIVRADGLQSLWVDQEYSLIDNDLTVFEQVQRFNTRQLPEHLLKTELHRFLFPADTWDKPCGRLSGGEKMRLICCCLLVGNAAPDLFVLDEPTNNLDIPSLELVTGALRDYRGTLLVVSHDRYFTREIGVERTIGW
jgi:ATPase subunit of ABC transporter with duplicated ATPase domains